LNVLRVLGGGRKIEKSLSRGLGLAGLKKKMKELPGARGGGGGSPRKKNAAKRKHIRVLGTVRATEQAHGKGRQAIWEGTEKGTE